MQNIVSGTRITSLCGSRGFCMHNSDFWTRIKSLYGSQTSPVVLCRQNGVFNTWITNHHGTLPSSVDFACKTWSFRPELQVSMGPRPHMSFCALQNSVICTSITSLYGFQPSSVVMSMKNSVFRTRLISLYGSQTSSVVLSTHNSVLSTWVSRLYWFQPSPVVFPCKTATSGTE